MHPMRENHLRLEENKISKPIYYAMKQATFLKSFLVVCLLFVCAKMYAQSGVNHRPNILFIEVDDLNYEYLSFKGSTIIKTPIKKG